MKIEKMKHDSENVEHDVKQERKKKKRCKETRKEEENNTVNGATEMNNDDGNIKKLKRSIPHTENGVVKKKKKKNKDASTVEKNTLVAADTLDEKVVGESEENVKCMKTESTKGDELTNTGNDSDKQMVTEKEIQKLTGKNIRASFNSAGGLEALKKFVKVCNENKDWDVAAEYLSAGGNVLEILRMLATEDKKNVTSATTVFSAISTLLIKIMAQYPQYQSSADEACRHLINSHLSVIYSMLGRQSNAKQRKVVLRLLAAMVSLGGNLARELLAHLSLQPPVLQSLVRHTKTTDSQSVRISFIHFILAFLVEGNVQIIRALLEKRGLLSSIFPDLMYDSKDIVNLVLTTVKTFVLENTGISKTMKLHVFSTTVIQNLVYLYNWKGPNNWPKGENRAFISTPEYIQEKEAVTDILHNFLITLLTSYRYGIAFHDRTLGTSRAKHNQLLNTVLQSLDRPWEHEKPSDLVIKILSACPDLIKPQFTLLESYMEPRASLKWVILMKFVRKIIQSIDAEAALKISFSELSMSNLALAATNLCIPGLILKNAVVPSLSHESVVVRHEAILTLLVMFNQIEQFLSAIKSITKDSVELTTFKNHTNDYIVKHVPSLDMILKVWGSVFTGYDVVDENQKDDVPEPMQHEQLNDILNLLHSYTNICPELLDATVHIQSSTLLTELSGLDDIDVAALNTIKVKAIQFLLALDPTEFAPHKEIFGETLSFLVSLLSDVASLSSSYANATIKTLLISTGLFEGCSDQLDIWMNGFINLENLDDREKVTNWFVNSIKKTAQHTEKYINSIIEAEESVNESASYAGGLDDIFNELLDKNNVVDDFETGALYMQQSTSISPLLCCMLHKIHKNPNPVLLSYASYVLVHTLHWQVSPDCLIHLAKDIPGLPVLKYLTRFLEASNPHHLKEMFPSMATTCKLRSALLSNDVIELNEIFDGDTALTFDHNSEPITINYTLSNYEIMSLLRMTIFYLTQLSARGTLTEIQNEKCTITLVSLLHMANKDANENSTFLEDCAKSIFTHPIILHYFSPLSTKKKDSVKTMITRTVYEVCHVLVHLNSTCNTRNLFSHIKNKYLEQLNNTMAKNQRCDKVSNVQTAGTLLQLLQLAAEDVVCLLDKLMRLESSMFLNKDATSLSLYGYIAPILLQMTYDERMKAKRSTFFKLDVNFVTHLYSHLLHLKSTKAVNCDSWELILGKYLSNFSYNVAGVNADAFLSLLRTKFTQPTVQLISFLISRNPKFIPLFINHITKSDDVKDHKIIFPILENNLANKWSREFLQKISGHYRNEIVSYLTDPKNTNTWVEEHIVSISYIVGNTFDLTACEEICNTILQIGDKLEMVSIQYVQLLQSLYRTYENLKSGSESPTMEFIQVFLHIITLTLKKQPKNTEKLRVLCEGLTSAVKRLKGTKGDITFQQLSNNRSWLQFTRFSLKLGLKDPKDVMQQVPILKTLNVLCDITYKNNSDNEQVKTLFEMATSHSEFVNIMLGSSVVKRDLIELLWILIHKQKSVMTLSHVPLYLSAYNATLSEVDQLILLILQYYENSGISIYEYRPHLWGSAAATHYSVKGEIDMALWRQPTTTQVLNLFEKEIICNTIKHYPVNRALKDDKLHEADTVYDPAFYLPLLCYLLSENNVVACHKVIQGGALALTFAACGSTHSDIRMMAYTIISRYYVHLEATSSKAKLLWMRLVDALRYGIISLESELPGVRLSCLVSTFLARTSLVATQPLHPLYSPLQMFLMAKPALDIRTIPELLQLFHSPDVEHKVHRRWILENIRDGMKTESDVELAFKYVLFKMLLDFYTCNLSDADSKILILEVIQATTRISKAAVLLMQGHSLLPWLLEVVKNLQSHDIHIIDLVIKIISNLLSVLPHPKGEVDHYRLVLLEVTLSLKSHFSKGLSIKSFTAYLSILQQLLAFKYAKTVVRESCVKDIVSFSKGLLDNTDECEDMLLHGCEYVTQTHCSHNDDELSVARASLKQVVFTWCSQGAR